MRTKTQVQMHMRMHAFMHAYICMRRHLLMLSYTFKHVHSVC